MKVFYPSFFRPFLLVFVLGAALGLPTITMLSGFSVPVTGYAWLSLLSAVFAALWTLAMMPLLKVRVGAEEINATDFWGFRRSLRWADIESTSRFRFLGLEWLRLMPADGSRPLWLPTFIRKRDAFLASVKEFAPADHPLLLGLLRGNVV